MGVVLPGWADELLDLIGVSWPNVDEDDYREMANAMREFADDIDEGANEAHTAIQGLVGSAGGSLAVEALNAHWGKVNGTHLKGLADCGRPEQARRQEQRVHRPPNRPAGGRLRCGK